MVICLGRGADLHMAQLMHCHSLSLAPVNPDWFNLPGFVFLVPAHLGNPGHSPGGRKTTVVVVVVVVAVVVVAVNNAFLLPTICVIF